MNAQRCYGRHFKIAIMKHSKVPLHPYLYEGIMRGQLKLTLILLNDGVKQCPCRIIWGNMQISPP